MTQFPVSGLCLVQKYAPCQLQEYNEFFIARWRACWVLAFSGSFLFTNLSHAEMHVLCTTLSSNDSTNKTG